MRHVRIHQVILVFVAAIGAASAARANVVFGSFAGGNADGFGSFNNGVVPFASDTTGSLYSFVSQGATDGDGSALDVNNNGSAYKQNLAFDFKASGLLSQFMSNDVISFDVYAPSAAQENTTAGYWQVYDLIINAPGWGFKTIATATPAQNQYYYSGFGGAEFHLSFNYDAVKAALSANPGYLQMIIANNDGGGATAGGAGSFQPEDFVYDNFQLSSVPEPASCSLLAMGAAGLLFRRRRN